MMGYMKCWMSIELKHRRCRNQTISGQNQMTRHELPPVSHPVLPKEAFPPTRRPPPGAPCTVADTCKPGDFVTNTASASMSGT